MRISDWSSDVCSSDLDEIGATRIIDHELVYPIFRIPADGPDGIAILDQRLEAHVLQDRNHVRERHSRLAMIELRSEEHTSELQSLMRISYAVFCLKKKNTNSNVRTPVLPIHIVRRHAHNTKKKTYRIY